MANLKEILEQREQLLQKYEEIVKTASKMTKRGSSKDKLVGYLLLKKAGELQKSIDDFTKEIVSSFYETYTKPI